MKKGLLAAALLALISTQLVYSENEFGLRLMPIFIAPIEVKNFGPGFGAALSLDWKFLFWGKFGLGLSAGGGFSSLSIEGSPAFSIFEGSLGPFFTWRPLDRFSLQSDINAGVYHYQWGDAANNKIRIGTGISAYFHLSPYISLYGSGAYSWYAFSADRPINAITAGVGLRLNLSEILKPQTRVSGEKTEQQRVFPVSYAWYEDNPVAAVKITNNEPNAITELSLSFFLERYMNQSTPFALIPLLLPGESIEVPVTALFNESMLDLIENINANALVLINYRSLGSRKQTDFGVQMPIYHRNAMSWDDDRRAASFVSTHDPAARLFARYVESAADSAKDSGIPRNIRYALALFEALRVYGINYIIDPASSYIEMSENASSIDNLNYPYQTLFYRGGDCDDLSILFCSLLEVLEIDTAFITIPGHIYAAFNTGVEPGSFMADGLIEHDGKF
ncbi:hypothetical protein [Leadbettera azotonutricia]|uniref:hypothetical protein n=1 Tax=Leadbettera azotonutricia TaxID=150829 RepID=UPI0002EEAFF5|nr:hypothetical protein [Leadbettera azotonutricia]